METERKSPVSVEVTEPYVVENDTTNVVNANELHKEYDKKSIAELERLEAIKKRVEPKRISLRISYPELRYLLKRNGIGLFVKGDLQAIKGAAKAGKSHALLILIVALLTGSFMGFTGEFSGIRVLYLDTEMNALNTAKMVRKVHAMAGWDTSTDNERFIALSLRDEAYRDRAMILEQAIELYRPDIVFLDGLRDLISDFNNIDESQGIINLLMRLTKQYDTAICSVMHIGKQAEAGMRGHAGAELLNKASEVWQIKKDGCHIMAEQTDCRNAPSDSWGFYIDGDGMPQSITIEKPLTKKEQNVQTMQENFNLILYNTPKGYTELSKDYQELAGVKEPTANRAIGAAVKLGHIRKVGEKYYLSPTA